MGSLLGRVRSFDIFGEPVGLNYKGDSNFKTLLGAFFSILLQSFILFFTLGEFLDLIDHNNPQITQVSDIDSTFFSF